MSEPWRERAAIRRWFDASLEIVNPRHAVASAVRLSGGDVVVGDRRVPLASDARLVVIAIGKAAQGLARGACDAFGDRIDRGIILTKYGHLEGDVQGFEAFEASHPAPDEAGMHATSVVLEAVRGLGRRDVVVALISGGGSALLELPRPGVSLEDMQEVTTRLMHAGAGIHDLNAVRTSLSEVKGGGLRRAIGEATCVTLLLSDVLGNDPSVIASGPTVIPDRAPADPVAVLQRFGLADDLPAGVHEALATGPDQTREVDASDDVVSVIGDNAMFVHDMALWAAADGLYVRVVEHPYDGDARELGSEMVRLAMTADASVDAIFRGGEATVAVTGDGVGGRNTEMALAAAIALEGEADWLIASLASDGDDGNSAAAGAIADGDTVRRAGEAGIDAAESLARNDSATVFRAAGGIVETGPTGTNVNDVYVALRLGRLDQEGDEG